MSSKKQLKKVFIDNLHDLIDNIAIYYDDVMDIADNEKIIEVANLYLKLCSIKEPSKQFIIKYLKESYGDETEDDD